VVTLGKVALRDGSAVEVLNAPPEADVEVAGETDADAGADVGAIDGDDDDQVAGEPKAESGDEVGA
jgi:hypothetical protein